MGWLHLLPVLLVVVSSELLQIEVSPTESTHSSPWEKMWSFVEGGPRARTAESLTVWGEKIVMYAGFGDRTNFDYLDDAWMVRLF